MKKIPQRTCMVCGDKSGKREMNRIVRNKEGEIFYDPSGKANGRGAYICSQPECIGSILKKNALNRAFQMEVPEEIKLKIVDDINAKK